MNPCAKPDLIPMTGGLVSRYTAGSNPTGSLTVALNVDGREPGHYDRLGGWQQYCYGMDCFGNQDLHDQISRVISGEPGSPLACQVDLDAEAVTMLHSATHHPSGARRIIAGTKSRVYAINDAEGTVRILGHGYGGVCSTATTQARCSDSRFKAATLGNITVLTNGVDDVLSWVFDAGPDDGGNISLKRIADLVADDITAAKHVMAFEGFIILADFMENGERQPASIIWSDFNNPISFTATEESLAGRMDLGSGERILGMAPLGGGWRLYTNRAIYHVTLVNDERVFAFEELCRNMPMVAYPNTLISTGDEHIWLGQDTMWLMGLSDRTPRQIDWLHQLGGVIMRGVPADLVADFPAAYGVISFAGLNKSNCEQPVAWWDFSSDSMWISWPTGTSVCPNRTLAIWPRTRKSSIIDHGFTSGVVHQPYIAKSLRQVMDEHKVCARINKLAPLESAGCRPSNEVVAYPSLYNASKSSANPMDQNSAIAAFCGTCIPALCSPCDTDPVLVVASAEDRTLKQFIPGHCVRSVLTGITINQFPLDATPCYSEVGYTWVLQGSVRRLGYGVEEFIHAVGVEFTAAEDIPYGVMEAQIGVGDQPSRLSWDSSDPLSLGPQDGGPASNVMWERSGMDPTFRFESVGYWMNWRIFGGGIGGCVSVGAVNINPAGC